MNDDQHEADEANVHKIYYRDQMTQVNKTDKRVLKQKMKTTVDAPSISLVS